MNMKDYILYNVVNQVLICCQHGYDISSKWITNHFQRQHKTIQLETRNKIIEYAKSLQLWDSERVLANHDGSFIEGLKVNTANTKVSASYISPKFQYKNTVIKPIGG